MFKILSLNSNRSIYNSSSLKMSNPFFNAYLFKNFAMELPVYRVNFQSSMSGQSGRSQRGIWQGKNHSTGFTISYSERHTLRKYKVNVKVVKLYSEILNKTFFLNCSTRAIRTIKKYGGLDNYLLKSSPKLIEDSQMALYIKSIILKKQMDPNFNLRYMPMTSKPKFHWKRRMAHEVRNLPSIYIPPEAKRTDLSEMYYPVDYFETRMDKQKRREVEKMLEQETDPVKRDELKKELNLERYTNKLKKDMLALMPIRQKWIRDGLVRARDRPTVKLNFLKTIEQSETYTKLMLGDQYKHFSEDYPEVQLILQQTEQEKYKKTKGVGNLYKEYNYDLGQTYEDSKKTASAGGFEPFDKKTGKKWDRPRKRMNAKMIDKLKDRAAKKEKKLNTKKKESKRQKSPKKNTEQLI